MRWTCVVTRFHYWILGKNVDLSGSPSGCARRTPLVVVAFGVLSVWWKTSASVSMLFRAVLPQNGFKVMPRFLIINDLRNSKYTSNVYGDVF